jgi:DNA-binding response OmpR family regulator
MRRHSQHHHQHRDPTGGTGREPEAVRISLLGGFRVWVGPRLIEEDRWRLRKARNLIKLLTLAPGHRLHREQVMEALWPELGMQKASNNLHQILHAVRRTLEPTAVATAPARSSAAASSGYLLLSDPIRNFLDASHGHAATDEEPSGPRSARRERSRSRSWRVNFQAKGSAACS